MFCNDYLHPTKIPAKLFITDCNNVYRAVWGMTYGPQPWESCALTTQPRLLFQFKYKLDKSTMLTNFDLTEAQTNELQITDSTCHGPEMPILTTEPSWTSFVLYVVIHAMSNPCPIYLCSVCMNATEQVFCMLHQHSDQCKKIYQTVK